MIFIERDRSERGAGMCVRRRYGWVWTFPSARDVPCSPEGAVTEQQDMRLAVVGFPTGEADIGRVDLDRSTLKGEQTCCETALRIWQGCSIGCD